MSVKNFLTSVPLVADLRSPAMRERHWTQLMTTTKVRQSIKLLMAWHTSSLILNRNCLSNRQQQPSIIEQSLLYGAAWCILDLVCCVYGYQLALLYCKPLGQRGFLAFLQVQFVLDANFKLDDLLKLELHKFADEVGEIVDCAQKEEKMEQGLAKLKVCHHQNLHFFRPCSLQSQRFRCGWYVKQRRYPRSLFALQCSECRLLMLLCHPC